MPYKIQPYSIEQAKKINVVIKPSTNKKKKIDVYKNDKKIASIGSMIYSENDYPTFILKKGKQYADNRRKLYKIRHNQHRNIKNTPSYFADKILW
jgi:hypothetical protein